jgi:small-conductance mechanosensitive channel
VRIHESELNQAIWWALKKEDIVIAFPQLDLHLDPPVMESLRVAATGVEE